MTLLPGLADVRGRTALVTGASRGIGLAAARMLAAAGVRVAMVARNAERLQRAAAAIRGHAISADVSSPAAVDRMAAEVAREFGDIPDVVVNVAGAFSLQPLADTEPADFDHHLEVNLRGPFLVVRAFLPRMLDRGGGLIVNVGSVAGRVALPGNAAYGASKFGLRGLHEVLAEEVRGTGVRTTLIEPAATDTPLWDPLDPDQRDDLPSRSQMLRADDVARAILFAVAQPAGVEVQLLSIRAS
jgi:NAD(P)-dependent dehydrogenase (short-subunit alcohol dehydrogenase family)